MGKGLLRARISSTALQPFFQGTMLCKRYFLASFLPTNLVSFHIRATVSCVLDDVWNQKSRLSEPTLNVLKSEIY